MKVTAGDVAVAATPASARVTFTQAWEMLASARAPSGAAIAAAERVAFIVGRYAIDDGARAAHRRSGDEPTFFGIQSWSDHDTGLELVPLSTPPRKLEVPYLDCPC